VQRAVPSIASSAASTTRTRSFSPAALPSPRQADGCLLLRRFQRGPTPFSGEQAGGCPISPPRGLFSERPWLGLGEEAWGPLFSGAMASSSSSRDQGTRNPTSARKKTVLFVVFTSGVYVFNKKPIRGPGLRAPAKPVFLPISARATALFRPPPRTSPHPTPGAVLPRQGGRPR
jgi:hypothetical protein